MSAAGDAFRAILRNPEGPNISGSETEKKLRMLLTSPGLVRRFSPTVDDSLRSVVIRDHRMSPTFERRDRVYFDPMAVSFRADGLYVVGHEDPRVFRIMYAGDGEFVVTSDCDAFPNFRWSRTELEGEMIGKAIGLVRQLA